VISNETLKELAAQVGVKLDESAMNGLRDIADDFVESVSVFAAEIAKHSNSDAIRAKDVQLHFEQNWGLPNPHKKAKTDVAATEEEKANANAAPASSTAAVPPSSAGASAPPALNPEAATVAPVRVTAHMQRLNVKQRLLASTAGAGGGGAVQHK
jgi:histone H3/H4